MQAEKLIKKRVDVLAVMAKDVERFWPLVHFMIAEALKYSGGFASPHHIKEELIKGTMQLFIVFGSDDGEKQKVFGCLVTRITDQPNLRQLEGIILTGEKRELWQDDMAEMIEHFAIQNDCKRLCMLARPGWSRVVKKYGWNVKHVELQKDLI